MNKFNDQIEILKAIEHTYGHAYKKTQTHVQAQ